MMCRHLLCLFTSFICVSSCAIFSEESSPPCEPACATDLVCLEGICQPIRCATQDDCSDELLCFEGRCVPTCDGASPCLSRECSGELCVATMQCTQGDVRGCESACGEGVERCVDFQWTTCSIGAPEPNDRCGDGVDNDCDGQMEEGCPACEEDEIKGCENECGIGEQRCEEGVWSQCSVLPPDAAGVCPCEAGSSERCETPCGAGQATCESGAFGRCLYEGNVCECAPGAVESCEAICGMGERVCEAGQWSSCQGPAPRDELCFNRVDDDCDQQVDEGCEEECTARPLNQNDYYGTIAISPQFIPLAASGTRVWLSWYSSAGAYAQGSRYENDELVKTDRFTLPVRSVADLASLSNGGGVAHLGIESQERIHMSFVSTNGLSETVTFTPSGTVWDARVVGDGFIQHIIYRTSALYLQRHERSEPNQSPPLRLSTRINHLGYDLVRGGGRISIFYQDDTAEHDEGRVLTMIQASDDGERLLGEREIIDPQTNEPLFISNRPTVIFKANQLLVAYTQRSQGLDYIKTVLLSLDGEVLSGPHTLLQSPFQSSPLGLDLAVTDDRRALVWYEGTELEDVTKIKYLALDEEGLPNSQIHMITRGLKRLFPQVVYDLNRRPVISWIQTDFGQFGEQFFSMRLAQFAHEPECQ